MATLKPFKTLGLPLPNLFSETIRYGRVDNARADVCPSKKASTMFWTTSLRFGERTWHGNHRDR